MRCRIALLVICMGMQAALVDRIAVTVGGTVITELQIDEDLRVAALLNGEAVRRDAESRRAAADRLVEQLLIRHEIEISRYPGPSNEEVDTLYSSVERTIGGGERLNELLAKYNLSQEILRGHLSAQLSALRFIEFRFRPDVTISDSEIEAAFKSRISALRAADAAAKTPALDAAQRADLSQVLQDERTDAALNKWLEESRKQINIRYIDASLR